MFNFPIAKAQTFEKIPQIQLNPEYNWYDSQGNLVYTGTDLSVSPTVTQEYQLEVITADGFKAYDNVQVEINPNRIVSMTPNPASNSVQVNFMLENTTSAYLMILNQSATSMNNYIIDSNTETLVLNLTNYTPGAYTVVLICDGVVKDAKQLIKQ